ncbi:hypothetical protein MCEKE4_01614 [Acidimicrobiia bacterium]
MSLRRTEGAFPRVHPRRSTLAALVVAAFAGILVSGISLSSALTPTAIVNNDRTYDCDLNYPNTFYIPTLYAGDSLTVTVAGNACDSMTFTVTNLFAGNAPTLTKNGNPVAVNTPTPVATNDVFVLTEQLGNGYGGLSFTNTSAFTWVYAWQGDPSNVPTSSTTATTPTTNPTTAPTTTPNGGAPVGDTVAGDPLAPAFTG